MTIKKNIINHMEFLGYEIEKMEADDYFYAKHFQEIPIMIKLKEGLPVSFETMLNITKKDPDMAKMGIMKFGLISKKLCIINFENIIATIAPTAAPLEIPINPGSTSGFLKRP